MGLSIHYSGHIKDWELIAGLVNEIEDICQSLDWRVDRIDSKKDQLKGVLFSPKDSEPIFLTFLPNGRLCSPISLMTKDIYEANGLDPELMFTCSVKTQYAGMDAHIAVIRLLRYVKEKYLDKFELNDEGMFWETDDVTILKSQFDRYNEALEVLTGILENFHTKPGESPESLADRVEKLLRETLDGGKNATDT